MRAVISRLAGVFFLPLAVLELGGWTGGPEGTALTKPLPRSNFDVTFMYQLMLV